VAGEKDRGKHGRKAKNGSVFLSVVHIYTPRPAPSFYDTRVVFFAWGLFLHTHATTL
jgi:hypothetical protein